MPEDFGLALHAGSTSLDDEWVHILVRRSNIEAHYAIEVGHVASPDGWTDAELDQMWQESSEMFGDILEVLVDNAGTLMRGADIAAKCGLSSGEFSGSMGGFSTRLSQRYNKPSFIEVTRIGGHQHYRISVEMADRIKRLWT
jgi:hypothetical protein